MTAATAELWKRVAVGPPALSVAAALTGADPLVLRDALSLSLAASPEAAELLRGMEFRIRTLKTTVATTTERCVGSVRGPILWSETITARANALGNDDVFVCSTAMRSFDTVENRVLVAALETLADAARALQTPTGRRIDTVRAAQIQAVAEEARGWRRDGRLRNLRAGRLSGRDMARLRGGHRLSSLAPVMAIRHRLDQPFVASDLTELTDPATRTYHRFVLEMFDALSARDGVPTTLTLRDGALWAGSTSFRHPRAQGRTPAGLCHGGTQLRPASGEIPPASTGDGELDREDGSGAAVLIDAVEDLDEWLSRSAAQG